MASGRRRKVPRAVLRVGTLLGGSLAALVVATALMTPSVASSESKSSLFASKLSDVELLRTLRTAVPRRFDVIGHSSVALRMRFSDRVSAAYKVESRAFPKSHLAEVAAYRVSLLLGLDNVPPAVLRRIPVATIDARMHRDSKSKWQDIRPEVRWLKDGIAEGAACTWVFGLRSLRLEERQPWWRAWLQVDTTIPKRRIALARDLSNMVAFDYLIGNPDRFSGRNMKVSHNAQRFVMLDHDQAFPPATDEEAHSDFLLKSLQMTQRFSRLLVERLGALDERALLAEIVAARGPLLTKAQITGLMERRKVLLSHVEKLKKRFGHGAVMFFD